METRPSGRARESSSPVRGASAPSPTASESRAFRSMDEPTDRREREDNRVAASGHLAQPRHFASQVS